MQARSDMPISFPGLFGDWEFNPDPVAIHWGNGIYWYGIIIVAGLLLAVLFCCRQAKRYGLTEDNLGDYLSDYDYWRLWPLNGWERIWINDKLTLNALVQDSDLARYVPAYFYYSRPEGLLPLSGSGVDSLTDVGDYHYYYPSAFARRLTNVIRTDGARYFDRNGNVVFEDIRYGEPYRQEYQALVVNRDIMLTAIKNENKTLVWYVTVHRGTNILANERRPDCTLGTEMSWLVWRDVDGVFRHCAMSDTCPEREFETNPEEIIKNLIEKIVSNDELEDRNRHRA